LLIVPAATASLLCRNMRQVFWWTIGLCLSVGFLGQWVSWELTIPDPEYPRNPIRFGTGGIIVVLSVLLFFLAMIRPWFWKVVPRLWNWLTVRNGWFVGGKQPEIPPFTTDHGSRTTDHSGSDLAK
jgi:hypothetical protein